VPNAKREALLALVQQAGAPYENVRAVTAEEKGDVYFVSVDTRHCQRIGRAHKSNRIFFRATAAGLEQRCHDAECKDYVSPRVPLPAHVRDVLFPPPAEMDVRMSLLDLVELSNGNTASVEAFSAAVSAYLGAAYRLGQLDEAKAHVQTRLDEAEIDGEDFLASLPSVPESALLKEAHKASRSSLEKKVSYKRLEAILQPVAAAAVTLPLTCPSGWTLQAVNRKYLEPLSDSPTVLIDSPMGSGKSEIIRQQVHRALKHGSVVWISPRIAYSKSLQRVLGVDNIRTILYSDWRDKVPRHSRLLQKGHVTIISPQSLHLLSHDAMMRTSESLTQVALLVLDELESSLQQMQPSNTHGDHLLDNWPEFERLTKEAAQVIAADAFLSDRSVGFVAALRPGAGVMVQNAFRPARGTALKISGPNDAAYAAWKEILLRYVKAKEHLYVVVTSVERNNTVAAELRAAGVSVQQHTGTDRDLEALRDVLTSWGPQAQVVIVTLTVTVGIDYNPKSEAAKFDRVMVWGHSGCGLARDLVQCVARARHLRKADPALVYTLYDTREDRTGHAELAETRMQLRQMQRKAAAGAFAASWSTASPVVRQVDVWNEIEATANKGAYEECVDTLLVDSGFKLQEQVVKPLAEEERTSGVAPPIRDYMQIATLTPDAFQQLDRERKSRGWTEDERWQVAKYLFRCTLTKQLPEPTLLEAWALSVEPKREDLSTLFWNLVAERKGKSEAVDKATRRVYDTQEDHNVDWLQYIAPLLLKLGLKTSVDDGAEVPRDRIAQVRDWLLIHEQAIIALLSVEPSTNTKKGDVWARTLASRMLKLWAGTKLESKRRGKKNSRIVYWLVKAPLRAVGQAVRLIPFVAPNGAGSPSAAAMDVDL
jgi:hypothetical protein